MMYTTKQTLILLAIVNVCIVYIPNTYGSQVKVGDNPYVVAVCLKNTVLLDDPPMFVCTGTIIKPNWVLTAHSCSTIIPDKEDSAYKVAKNNYIAVAGFVDYKDKKFIQQRDVTKWIPHASYSSNEAMNDLALLELVKDFSVGQRVNVIKLPNKKTLQVDNLSNCKVIGWGMLNIPEKAVQERIDNGYYVRLADMQTTLDTFSYEKVPEDQFNKLKEKLLVKSKKGTSDRLFSTVFLMFDFVGGPHGDIGSPLVADGGVLFGVLRESLYVEKETVDIFTKVDLDFIHTHCRCGRLVNGCSALVIAVTVLQAIIIATS